MKQTLHMRLLLVVLSALFAVLNVQAFDLEKSLKKAVKQKMEETKQEGSPTPEAPPNIAPSPAATEATTAQTAALPEPAKAEKPSINWKNPSAEEEASVGREVAGSILGAAPLVKDAALQAYVNKIGRWVAAQSDRAAVPWYFGVIESNDINAFAAPGGYVLITKGLYQRLNNEAELAGVLGHEIAHVTKKHHLKVIQKQQLLNAGKEMLAAQLGKGDLAKTALGHGAEIMARGLDKNAEFEADRVGMTLATRAGYEPYGLVDVLQTISQTAKGDSSIALLYKTHPSADERLTKLGSAIGDKLDKVKDGKTLEKRLHKLN